MNPNPNLTGPNMPMVGHLLQNSRGGHNIYIQQKNFMINKNIYIFTYLF